MRIALASSFWICDSCVFWWTFLVFFRYCNIGIHGIYRKSFKFSSKRLNLNCYQFCQTIDAFYGGGGFVNKSLLYVGSNSSLFLSIYILLCIEYVILKWGKETKCRHIFFQIYIFQLYVSFWPEWDPGSLGRLYKVWKPQGLMSQLQWLISQPQKQLR